MSPHPLWLSVYLLMLSTSNHCAHWKPELPDTQWDTRAVGLPSGTPVTVLIYLLQVYLLILSVTTLSLLLAPVLWKAAITKCVPRPERRSSLWQHQMTMDCGLGVLLRSLESSDGLLLHRQSCWPTFRDRAVSTKRQCPHVCLHFYKFSCHVFPE